MCIAGCHGNADSVFAGPTYIWAFSCPMFWNGKKVSALCISHSCSTGMQGIPAVFTLSLLPTSYTCVCARMLLPTFPYPPVSLHCQWRRLQLLVINISLITTYYLSHAVAFSECCNRSNTPALPLPQFHVFTLVCHCCNFCITADDNMCAIKQATDKQIVVTEQTSAYLLGLAHFGQNYKTLVFFFSKNSMLDFFGRLNWQ